MFSEKRKDFALDSGERQIAAHYGENRADHRYRYEWVADTLGAADTEGWRGLDIFCGTGYGTRFLADRGYEMEGYEGSQESVAFARAHYGAPNASYHCELFPFPLPRERFDFACCFESLEHLSEAAELFYAIVGSLKVGGALFLSVPNEELMPFGVFRACYPFHFKHFTRAEIERLAEASPSELRLESWFGQDTYALLHDPLRRNGLLEEELMCLEAEQEGQTLIFHYTKVSR